MHKAALDLQKAMQKMKKSYREYYVLKMDIKKYFNSIDKKIIKRNKTGQTNFKRG